MTLKRWNKFEFRPSNTPLRLGDWSRFVANNGTVAGSSDIRRECIDCLLLRIDLAEANPPWITIAGSRLVACRGCNYAIRRTPRVICRRQRFAELCDRCFRHEKVKWNDFKKTLRAGKDELKEMGLLYGQKRDHANHEADIGCYLKWMEEVDVDHDGGRSSNPPDLPGEELPEPEWNYLNSRDDTTTKQVEIRNS